MKASKAIIAELRKILEDAGSPSSLDGHPWTQSLTVTQKAAANRSLQAKSPGYQLIATLAGLFRETMPSAPPRRGKRPDTRWGQFGMLTALYFAPFEFSTVHPSSLLDAWGRIDQVIPLFVFGQPADQVPEAQAARYQLLAQEADTAPASTLSDWHVKGLERLAEALLNREAYLSQHLNQPSVILGDANPSLPVSHPDRADHGLTIGRYWLDRIGSYLRTRRFWLVAFLLVVVLIAFKGWRLTDRARAVQADIAAARSLVGGALDPDQLDDVGDLLVRLRRDTTALRSEAQPLVWFGPLLAWVPTYGGDLAAAGSLLRIAEGMTASADETYQALRPLTQTAQSSPAPTRSELVEQLAAARPGLLRAQASLSDSVEARATIDVQSLSTGTGQVMTESLDPYLALLQDGVNLALAGPKLLGAAQYGPQTYLILLQNEDELRATGGFITAVGSVTIDRGSPLAFTVEESYAVDDLSRPYLPAPWQLDRYMASHLWLLRDSNWSPDFPTAAALAEHDYAYTRFHSVDGVIALNQEAIRLILSATGPLKIDDEAEPITDRNFIKHLRAEKDPSQCGGLDPEKRKECKVFLRPLTAALLKQLQTEAIDWPALGSALSKALAGHHILIQIDDPATAAVLTKWGWDGAIQPGPGDYLMVVDSNLGFNKVNAAVAEELLYEVDLRDPLTPTARLTITHHNQASGASGCQPGPDYGTGEYADLIARCYWDYVRVYTHAETELRDAAPHVVPAEWMLRGEAVPAQVDSLETINGARAYGTLLVVPEGQSLETQFQFALPAGILTSRDGRWTYQLRIQKQGGAAPWSVVLRVRLPEGTQIMETNTLALYRDWVWQAGLTLRSDQLVDLTYRLP